MSRGHAGVYIISNGPQRPEKATVRPFQQGRAKPTGAAAPGESSGEAFSAKPGEAHGCRSARERPLCGLFSKAGRSPRAERPYIEFPRQWKHIELRRQHTDKTAPHRTRQKTGFLRTGIIRKTPCFPWFYWDRLFDQRPFLCRGMSRLGLWTPPGALLRACERGKGVV